MDDGPEQGGQDDYEPDVAARVASAAKQKAAKEYFLACCPKRLARNVQGEQFGIVAVRSCSGLMSSAAALAKAVRLGESQRQLPGSGDRRAGQFALAKGKLHGLLSGAEPRALSRRVKMLGSETAQ